MSSESLSEKSVVTFKKLEDKMEDTSPPAKSPLLALWIVALVALFKFDEFYSIQ